MGVVQAADEALLVALLNTTPTVDGVLVDRIADETAAREWVREHGGDAEDAEDAAVLRATRDALRRLALGEASPHALAEALDGAAYRPVVDGDGLSWRLVAAPGRALAARAAIAWDSVRRTAPGRLRPCANDECSLFLLDRSKSNSARWCSMAGCGNRMKARRHYERRRNDSER